MSNYRQLLASCVKGLSTFDPSSTGIEDHLKRFLECEKSQSCPVQPVSEDSGHTFVREVLAGCVRYRDLIKVVVNGYYCSVEGHSCLKADTHLYHVLCYLLLFRLEELGLAVWRGLVSSQHTGKMYKFLNFFLQEANLKGWITAEWYKVYDRQFVDSTILSPLMRFHADLQQQTRQMGECLAGKSQHKPPSRTHTEPVPFNLTKPQPRSIPTPEKVPALKPHKPIPPSTYSKPAEKDKLAEAYRTNRIRAQATLEEAERRQFACANAEKSEKTKARMEEILCEREAELHYQPRKPEPVPLSLKEGGSVKLNTAAVLREGARVHREELQQEKRLASLEAGERDATEFTRWQEEMKQREAAERLAEVERRHLQAQLSYEEAIIARQSHQRDTHDKARAVREESESLMQAYFAEREEQQRELRRLVEATVASHLGTKEARTQLQAMKKRIVQEVSAESQVLMARALEEAEQEMRSRAELIRQIRAMESVPVVKTKFVDLTETGGQGLLAEMSVAELRERLFLMKVAEEEEEERKRQEIAAAKQAKEQLLSETRDSISRHRKEQSRHALSKQEREEAVFSRHHSELREKKISQLQEKLQDRRKERKRLQCESQVKPTATGRKQGAAGSKRLATPSPSPITSTLLQATKQTAVS